MLRKYASSPKLSVKEDSKISVKNFSGNGPSAASSMLNLKAKKNSLEEHLRRHPPLKEHKSAPQADQISVRDSASQLSRRTSKLSLRKASEEVEFSKTTKGGIRFIYGIFMGSSSCFVA